MDFTGLKCKVSSGRATFLSEGHRRESIVLPFLASIDLPCSQLPSLLEPEMVSLPYIPNSDIDTSASFSHFYWLLITLNSSR
jgi:hypothetical protein